MSVTPTYPGVYIQEIPSGVHTITGVATSIAAFIGRARKGPVDEAVTINSFGDFERVFGGLAVDSPLSYAVRDFYLNGGGQAIIVRLYKPGKDGGKAKQAIGNLNLEAASPGVWGNNLTVAVDYNAITSDVADRYGFTTEDLFNLTVTDTTPHGSREHFRNVSLKEGPRRVDRVLAQSSQLVRLQSGSDLPNNRPPETTADDLKNPPKFTGGADSQPLDQAAYEGSQNDKTGLYALEKVDLFNLLCIPPDTRDGDTQPAVYQTALEYCVKRRAMLIVDSPSAWNSAAVAANINSLNDLGLSGDGARNAALYFPRVVQADPLREGHPDTFVPSGIVAGVMARTDAQRGVWKAPAGLEASLNGIQSLTVKLTDAENGELNPLGINCLRTFPVAGSVVWGARTLRGADQLADEYKYVPVRRLALFLEESLYRGTQWVVFEPNDEPLWAQIRLNVGAFMHNLFRQGAFQGQTPRQAYFVKCDSETTTQNDINLGIVNIIVGFAPLKPAEFVVISLQQIAGQIQA